MSSSQSKTKNDLILHQALEARMLKAIEFAEVAAELDSLEITADAYLVRHGYISEKQREQILEALATGDRRQADATHFEAHSHPVKTNDAKRASDRTSDGSQPSSKKAQRPVPRSRRSAQVPKLPGVPFQIERIGTSG